MKTLACSSPNAGRAFHPIHLSLVALCVGLVTANGAALVSNVSRFTILSETSYREESGGLYRNGQYRWVRSSTGHLFPGDKELLEPIKGRTVMPVEQFELYQAARLIPPWVTHSVATYPFGIWDYLILSVKGGPDPNPLPVFFDEPESKVVHAGTRLVLSGLADPFELMSYQWLKNGKPIAGQTDSLLIIEECKKGDGGNYTLRASLGNAVAVSRTANVTVVFPVTIRRDLENLSVKKGKSISLRVFATGTRPLTYEWFRNGQPVAGVNTPRLVIRPVTEGDAGFYFVRIRNAYTVKDSSLMTLIVTQ